MKIFITGSKGFIGTNLIKNFEGSEDIVVTDYKSKGKRNRLDILNKSQLDLIEENVDAIVHLAAKTSITNSISNPYDVYYTNICGTLNILDFARERKIKKIINLSTYVYGNPEYIPIDEKHSLNPHTPYNKSKVLSENLCKYYSHDYGINIVTLRPFYIYGPLSNPFSFIPTVIQQIRKNGSVILSAKNTKRDFLFIDDFINLIIKILNKFPVGYNVLNVGYGKSCSLEEIIKIIEQIKKIEIDIQYDNCIRPNDVENMEADTTKVRKLFDWRPQISLEKGLELTLESYNFT